MKPPTPPSFSAAEIREFNEQFYPVKKPTQHTKALNNRQLALEHLIQAKDALKKALKLYSASGFAPPQVVLAATALQIIERLIKRHKARK